MTNLTQCPNCFTSFEISDAQLSESQGKVRCGTCRETFHAVLIDNSPESLESYWAQQGPPDISQFNFDPIRGPGDLTDDLDEKLDESEHSNQTSTGGHTSGSRLPGVGTSIPPYVTHDLKGPMAPPLGGKLAIDGSIEGPAEAGFRQSIEENLHSDLTIEMDSENTAPSGWKPKEEPTDNSGNQSPRLEFDQAELDLANLESAHQELLGTTDRNAARSSIDDQELIAEVDQLIDYKLLAKQHESAEHGNPDSKKFEIGKQPKSRRPSRWVITLLWSIAAIVLLTGLIYQLWLRQAIPLLENPKVQAILTPIVTPLLETLSERFDITLPARRHLDKLQLLSARTEAHPMRSSTTLLRISLINHSEISQPYPWLELSLTDIDGRLVSRRALAPQSYLHNNRLKNEIGARELRSITVELLAFPKIADGYELKLLNK